MTPAERRALTAEQIEAMWRDLERLEAARDAARAKLPTPRIRLGQPDTADPADVAAFRKADAEYLALRNTLALIQIDRAGGALFADEDDDV